MFKINDLVTRKSYSNDVIFRIASIEDNVVRLKGEVIRLVADASIDDLVLYDVRKKVRFSLPSLEKDINIMEGRVLHIDGDPYYLKKAMDAYKSYKIDAYGYFLEEDKISIVILDLIKKHHPNIVVITGHDSIKQKGQEEHLEAYQNSKYFIEVVNMIRSVYPSKDDLIIIAGACQSYYEKLIESGANFASSPSRKNIHLFDPVIVASVCSLSKVYEYLDIEKTIDMTFSHELGGVDTKGTARKNYYKKVM